jgi:adenylate cyclase class IV
MAVRSSGVVNMFDVKGVIEIAKALGFKEAAEWIKENKKAYSQGIMQGFEVE